MCVCVFVYVCVCMGIYMWICTPYMQQSLKLHFFHSNLANCIHFNPFDKYILALRRNKKKSFHLCLKCEPCNSDLGGEYPSVHSSHCSVLSWSPSSSCSHRQTLQIHVEAASGCPPPERCSAKSSSDEKSDPWPEWNGQSTCCKVPQQMFRKEKQW